MPMTKKTIFFVISVCLIHLTTLPSNGYCDDWVYVSSNEKYTKYYNASSVKIDKKNATIKVWMKRVYTEKGKIDFLKHFDDIKKQKYIDIDYKLGLYEINYLTSEYRLIHIIYYSKLNNVLYDGQPVSEWHLIKRDSSVHKVKEKIMHDYHILSGQ